MTSGAAPGGFLGWIATYGQYIAFIAQIIYWIVIAAVAVWAVLLFKRLVDFRTAVATPTAPSADSGKKSVKVEEFTD
jgi:hypothetical protein